MKNWQIVLSEGEISVTESTVEVPERMVHILYHGDRPEDTDVYSVLAILLRALGKEELVPFLALLKD